MIIMKEKITGVFLAFLGICFSCQSVKQDKVQGDTHIDYNYLKSHFQNPKDFTVLIAGGGGLTVM